MMQVNHKIHVNMLACLNIELQKSFFEAFMVTKICHYEDVKKIFVSNLYFSTKMYVHYHTLSFK